ncbi:MAG: hypothetical protein LLG08_07085 [Actinomycetia bacterium]|nr:hypothetical protein [Actinomycetes bacterium]
MNSSHGSACRPTGPSQGGALAGDVAGLKLAKNYEWLQETTFQINGKKRPCVSFAGKSRAYRDALRQLAEERGLSALSGLEWAEKNGLQLVLPADRSERIEAGEIRIAHHDVYRSVVAVPCLGMTRRRYVVPILRPSYVSEIRFVLSGNVATSQTLSDPALWSLFSPCGGTKTPHEVAFLFGEQVPAELNRAEPGAAGWGRLFMPGNGAQFFWQ